MRRFFAIAMSLTLLAACGGRSQPGEFPTSYPRPATELELPEPVPAVPAFLALIKGSLSDSTVRKVRGIEGVAIATPVGLETFRIDGRKVLVGAVDPVPFRSVTPSTTRDADFVWSALLAGNAVVSFETANDLGLTEANTLQLEGRTLQIGAFADNGSPGVADILIDHKLAEEMDFGGRRALSIGTDSAEDRGRVRSKLERILGSDLQELVPQVQELYEAEDPEPQGAAQGGLIGRMDYKILEDGFIEPDPNWVAANIVTADVPILGQVLCHRLLVPQMASALAEIDRAGLADRIDTSDYGGCYVPRFISRDPERALSMHAFGLAFDLNVQTNLYGTEGEIDPQVVEILQRWGFEWGGDWDPPDPMHFELDRLIHPSS
jgi:hypothetical protein